MDKLSSFPLARVYPCAPSGSRLPLRHAARATIYFVFVFLVPTAEPSKKKEPAPNFWGVECSGGARRAWKRLLLSHLLNKTELKSDNLFFGCPRRANSAAETLRAQFDRRKRYPRVFQTGVRRRKPTSLGYYIVTVSENLV
jgi:hypothetical protein